MLGLAEAGLYRPLWSGSILGELDRALTRRTGPGTVVERRSQVTRLLDEMTRAFEDALVTGYEPIVNGMTNDPKDRHVLAAAVRAGAAAVVTFNLCDFPETSTKPLEIEAVHPQDFLLNQLDLDPARVVHTLERQVAGNRRQPMTMAELCDSFDRCHLPDFATRVRHLMSQAQATSDEGAQALGPPAT